VGQFTGKENGCGEKLVFGREENGIGAVTAVWLRGRLLRGLRGWVVAVRVGLRGWVVAVREGLCEWGCAGGSGGGYRLRTFSSVRLFFALPSGVLLSAMGWVSPQPLGERRAGVMPLAIR
jgi:hypothetical protein